MPSIGETNTQTSSPTSPLEKVREKRQRASDEPEEGDVESLTRSSKRVVSPTDVKRKPSRGVMNGGRKIAISLGKK